MDSLKRNKEKRFDNVNRKVAEYENRVTLLNQEIERLNINLKRKMEESNDRLDDAGRIIGEF
jgi:uncharacterized small protein (DUF1192 family)